MKKRAVLFTLVFVLFCACVPLQSSAASSFKLQRLETGYLNQIVPSQMSVQLTPIMKNATSEVRLVWKVNDSSVASVDQNGMLTPKKAGKVKVTATAVGFEQSVTTTVTFAKARLNITGGAPKVLYNDRREFRLEIEFADEAYSDAAYRQGIGDELVEWSVDNSAAASVDAGGVLRGISPGTVNVTARVRNANGFTASQTVQIVNGFIDFAFANSQPIVDVGFAMQPRIEAHVSYVGNDDTVIWESVDGKAQITDLTTEYTEDHVSIAKLTFLDSGKAVIRARLAADTGIYSDYEFQVLPYAGELAEVIDEAVYGYDINAYTALRWNNLQNEIARAKAVYENADATQRQINAAIASLRAVMAEMSTPDFAPSNPSADSDAPVIPTDTSPDAEGEEEETQTERVLKKVLMKRPGSAENASYLWLYIILGAAVVLLAGGVSAIILVKRRRKANASAAADEKSQQRSPSDE